jgi:hypothetical protein
MAPKGNKKVGSVFGILAQDIAILHQEKLNQENLTC